MLSMIKYSMFTFRVSTSKSATDKQEKKITIKYNYKNYKNTFK